MELKLVVGFMWESFYLFSISWDGISIQKIVTLFKVHLGIDSNIN